MTARRFVDWGAAAAGGVVGGVLAVAWVVLRVVGRDLPAEGPRVLPGVVVAWLLVMWVIGTAGVVLWAAGVAGPRATRRAWAGWAWIVHGAALLVLAVGWDSGGLRWVDGLKIYVLAAAWLGFWTAAAEHLRRWGPGLAVAGPLLAALVLLAGPVALVPAFRAVSISRQAEVVDAMADACPMLGTLEAARGSGAFAWEQQAEMYHLTTLGQDVPRPDVAWWLGAAVFGGLGAALGLGVRLYRAAA